MLTAGKASQFANEWIEAWNNHALERIVAHYTDDIVFSSPFVASIGGVATATLCGRAELGAYFKAALSKFPLLRFELRSVFYGTDALTIIYKSVNGLLAAETMVLSDEFLVKRVWAQYDK
ncbi:MAG: nuclear transport factor 2 family protein [Acidobacteriia bacterium]|nr:nuclear transport factor 2 family protein [Terriglobia bacterium]